MADPTRSTTLLDTVKEYLADQSGSWSDVAIESAFNAEKKAQAKHCVVPIPTTLDPDPIWDDDLAEALSRRVAHNLALRGLPLGLKSSVSEMAIATSRVGGEDAEVRRLEGPFKRVVFG